jgi:hypothetical protein
MPCHTPSDAEMNANGHIHLGQAFAVLCGVMTADPAILDRIDWVEVGVPRDAIEKWWERHQQEDQKRREKL